MLAPTIRDLASQGKNFAALTVIPRLGAVSIPLAVGLGYAVRYRGGDGVALAVETDCASADHLTFLDDDDIRINIQYTCVAADHVEVHMDRIAGFSCQVGANRAFACSAPHREVQARGGQVPTVGQKS